MKLKRVPLTWYCYLLSGFFTFILNIQGNMIPFLRDELQLNYREVSLHPSAIALGMIVTGGLTGRVVARFGRRRALHIAVGGSLAGVVAMVLAPSVVFSVAGCFLVGLTGAMIPGIIAGLLAQLHGPARDQAYAECGAVTYACVVVSNLAFGSAVALGLGWRAALLSGGVLGITIILGLGRGPVPDPLPVPADHAAPRGLPLPCIVFLMTLGLGVALEFAVLLWAPAYLEQVAGLTRSEAATAAAAFPAAMLLGRWAGSFAVRHIAPATMFPAALCLVVPGFALYWVLGTPVPAVAGLFVLGLAVAPLYPLGIGLAISAAGARGEMAGARSGFAAGTALLLSPMVLGWLADAVGLATAPLAIPLIAAACMLCFAAARVSQRKAALVTAA